MTGGERGVRRRSSFRPREGGLGPSPNRGGTVTKADRRLSWSTISQEVSEAGSTVWRQLRFLLWPFSFFRGVMRKRGGADHHGYCRPEIRGYVGRQCGKNSPGGGEGGGGSRPGEAVRRHRVRHGEDDGPADRFGPPGESPPPGQGDGYAPHHRGTGVHRPVGDGFVGTGGSGPVPDRLAGGDHHR